MKTLALCLIMSLMLTACGKSQDGSSTVTGEHPLTGQWSLSSVSCDQIAESNFQPEALTVSESGDWQWRRLEVDNSVSVQTGTWIKHGNHWDMDAHHESSQGERAVSLSGSSLEVVGEDGCEYSYDQKHTH